MSAQYFVNAVVALVVYFGFFGISWAQSNNESNGLDSFGKAERRIELIRRKAVSDHDNCSSRCDARLTTCGARCVANFRDVSCGSRCTDEYEQCSARCDEKRDLELQRADSMEERLDEARAEGGASRGDLTGSTRNEGPRENLKPLDASLVADGGPNGIDVNNPQRAQQIAATCNSRCGDLLAECKKGGAQAACYKGAACQCQCYIDITPDGLNVPKWRQCVRENTANANGLMGSKIPPFDFGKPVQTTPQQQPKQTNQQPSRNGCIGCASPAR